MFSKRAVRVGKLMIGGNNRIWIQSMLDLPNEDLKANVAKAKKLEGLGCDIIRVSVPNKESVKTLFALKNALSIPVVADVHFDYRLALESVQAGADKIRINPGNIADAEQLKQVVNSCRQNSRAIRVGVNSGSLPRHILEKHGATAVGLAEAAIEAVCALNSFDFEDIIVSAKSSGVAESVECNRLIASRLDYPIHLGVTEAGVFGGGVIKSAIGLGSLLMEGIGDTIRVSLTDDCQREVEAGINILKVLGLRDGVNIISCPTCGRTKINISELTKQVTQQIRTCGLAEQNIKIAIMGCVVNGPGESKDADFGITGGDGVGVIFKKGQIVKKTKESKLVLELMNLIRSQYSDEN